MRDHEGCRWTRLQVALEAQLQSKEAELQSKLAAEADAELGAETGGASMAGGLAGGADTPGGAGDAMRHLQSDGPGDGGEPAAAAAASLGDTGGTRDSATVQRKVDTVEGEVQLPGQGGASKDEL